MKEPEVGKQAMEFGDFLHKNTINSFWDSNKMLFINNKPWLVEERSESMCDRSLATAVLFDLCPGNRHQAVIDTLVARPANLGMSYPPNTNWYLWALGKAGKTDAIFHDLNTRWKQLRSAYENNTMQEDWQVVPDTGSQWSHASIAPLLTAYMDLAGIKPVTPGYKQFIVEPLPGSLELLELKNYTPAGPISFKCSGKLGNRVLSMTIPAGISGELVLDAREKVKLKELDSNQSKKHFELEGGTSVNLKLKYL
jgi:alpha-L-rhamnosidase